MGRTLLSSSEQTLFESTEVGEYHGYVFLQNMGSGDTVTLALYVKNVEDSQYYLGDTLVLTDAQSVPVVRVYGIVGKVGVKVTAKQTVGTARNIDHMWFKK
jgi:hypothetical protein